MKIKRILSATLATAMLLCCCALTACASKPAAPTAADFEVQPGAYRYQDIDVFFKRQLLHEPVGRRIDPLFRARQPRIPRPVQ